MRHLMAEDELSLTRALTATELAKSSWYYRPRPRPPRPLNPKLVAAIEATWSGTRGVYGYRKVHATLRAGGLRVNKKAVLRHLRVMQRLQPRKIKGRRWTRPRVVRPTVSNVYWEMDLTYVWCGSRFGYLFAVVDACDKGIPGARFGDRCRAMEAVEALEEAVAARFDGGRVPEGHRLILRVDRGSQFVARRFREATKALNVTLEYAGIQCPEDKPYIESFFGHYKTEEVYRNAYASLAEAQVGWQLYRVWYEADRVHQSLGYQTPQAVRHGVPGLVLSKAQNGTV
ncbi:MAG: IS3 family transposase [Candidatus Omnitrophica bacterium]|nr:IS3 family transposase [Candidatus Omnitrophota bacterium]